MPLNETQPVLQMNGMISVPWSEYIGKGGMSDGGFGYDGAQQYAYPIMVYWGDLRQAIADLLGTNVPNTASGQLSRQLPARHPIFDWLLCSRISGIHPWKFLDKVSSVGTMGSVSQYDRFIINCIFSAPKWSRTLSDAQLDSLYGSPRAEWYRWTILDSHPNNETINRDQGAFYWSEGAPTVTGGPNIGDQFKGVQYLVLGKVDLTLRWFDAPYWGVYSRATQLPNNLLAGFNTLNNATFYGSPAGTLRFGGYRLTPKAAPIAPELLGLNPLQGEVGQMLDCELYFQRFDPPAGTASNITPGPNYNTGATTRGHNLAPFASGTGNAGAGEGLWWAINTRTNGMGQGIYQYSSFANLFAMIA